MDDYEERIEIDEENLGGKPVIKGTSVAVHVLVGALAEGGSTDLVAKEYGVSREDVLAAVAWAAETVADEPIHLNPNKPSGGPIRAWTDRVEMNDGILSGKPVIRGTRVPVYVILGDLSADASIEEVCKDYRINKEDVLAALAYGARSVAIEVVHALPS